MVSFVCDLCQKTLKKQQVNKHCETACKNAWDFSCVDCGKTFSGYDYENHTSCMTEQEKYWGQYANGKKGKGKDQGQAQQKTDKNPKEENTKDENKKPTKEEATDKKESSEDSTSNSWKGWKKTIKAVLKETEGKKMKIKKLMKQVKKIKKTSDENGFDSDDFEEEFNAKVKKGKFVVDDKYVSLSA
mmetsp:Transcript_12005/g.13151  ORF Transcript_12005/g.13151 Transcript_12005/m.13151 type:complete len:187 (-) Transcript_12005:78-638(-)|eukprot:CAMPEP_0115018600 /NCGR_PEP_ID=MMETSP0216-20121206/28922_1 /TAXON_ID=223996 /ORGANISM="Protocruzia adherens, Strain Boccale" /LENGTH=186 /DNA_ID=CAMNT_0002389865 /DNA_START=97 /DNA_END=657 /DNA_ORIENTATION=+